MICQNCANELPFTFHCRQCKTDWIKVLHAHADDGGEYLQIASQWQYGGEILAVAKRNGMSRTCLTLRLETMEAQHLLRRADEDLIVLLTIGPELYASFLPNRNSLFTQQHPNQTIIVHGHQSSDGHSVGDVVFHAATQTAMSLRKPKEFVALSFVSAAFTPPVATEGKASKPYLEKVGQSLKVSQASDPQQFPDILRWKNIIENFVGKDIQDLSIQQASITDAHLGCLDRLSTLVNISLTGCRQIGDAALQLFKSLQSLHSLDLVDCSITLAGLHDVASCGRSVKVKVGGARCPLTIEQLNEELALSRPAYGQVKNGVWLYLKART